MSPNPNRFGRLLAGWALRDGGAICARCGKGGAYLIGEPGEERHLRCWQDDPKAKGKPKRRRPTDEERGPQLFDPDAAA